MSKSDFKTNRYICHSCANTFSLWFCFWRAVFDSWNKWSNRRFDVHFFELIELNWASFHPSNQPWTFLVLLPNWNLFAASSSHLFCLLSKLKSKEKPVKEASDNSSTKISKNYLHTSQQLLGNLKNIDNTMKKLVLNYLENTINAFNKWNFTV
jgi:hypothetical protein